jgi:hypothetical protein
LNEAPLRPRLASEIAALCPALDALLKWAALSAVLLHLAKLLDQHLLGDRGDRSLEVRKPEPFGSLILP